MTTRPPSGMPPPTAARIGEAQIDLTPVVDEICDRYYEDFPDEHQRYGEVGAEWCRHDNRWLVSWAAYDVQGATDLIEQATWLARVLFARGFALERQVQNLRIAADVVGDLSLGEEGVAVASRLRDAAKSVQELDLTTTAPVVDHS